MTTIYDLLTELQSFTTIDDNILSKAKDSNIRVSNNGKFKTLVRNWVQGMYDEDLDCLVTELNNML